MLTVFGVRTAVENVATCTRGISLGDCEPHTSTAMVSGEACRISDVNESIFHGVHETIADHNTPEPSKSHSLPVDEAEELTGIKIAEGNDHVQCNTVKKMFAESPLTFINPAELAAKKVYSFFDEGEILFRAYMDCYNRPSSNSSSLKPSVYTSLVDCFAGAGHASIPILKHSQIDHAVLLDIDEAALDFARQNIRLNQLSPETVKTAAFDMKDEQCTLTTSADTLFIANPPFALNIQGAPVHRMRDGGEDGLELTRHAVKRFIQIAKEGCVFLGLAYSLVMLDSNGKVVKSSLEDFLNQEKVKRDGIEMVIKIDLLSEEKIWRGIDGHKRQPNPMPLTAEHFNAKTKEGDISTMKAYKNAEDRFKEQGEFSHLAYFSYKITVQPKY